MPSPARALPTWDLPRVGDVSLARYSDRLLAPEDTVRRMWPYLGQLGITRVARQTGLDRVGIPCWAAFRPNSRNLATAQGKGLTDAAACASALMEAAEIAIAERPAGRRMRTSARALTSRGTLWLNPERLLPTDTSFDEDIDLDWIEGRDLHTNGPVWVPLDAADMDGEQSELKGICKTSNGLASGNSEEEAMFHAICEMVERDGTAHWSFLSDKAAHATAFSSSLLDDHLVDHMFATIEAAGLRLTLFDQTTDLKIPVVMAVLGPKGAEGAGSLEIAAGYGAHPVAARAALRAITEAAQSRVTSIAAARDDIAGALFQANADEMSRCLLSAVPVRRAPADLVADAPLEHLLAATKAALASNAIGAIVVSMAAEVLPCSVVRVLSPDLEDRGANLNWRPGRRCLRALAN